MASAPRPTAAPWPVRPYREALAALDTIRRLSGEERQFGMLVGTSGSGKSRVLRDYAQANPGVRLCTLPPTDLLTPTSFLAALSGETWVIQGRESRDRLYHFAARNLQPPNCTFLLLDEADRLTPRQADLLRGLSELAECPVCIAGLPPVDVVVAKVPAVATRVVLRHAMAPVTAEDLLPIIGPDSLFAMQNDLRTWDESIIRAAVAETGGNLRQVQILLRQLEMVEAAGTSLSRKPGEFLSAVVEKVARAYLVRAA